MPENDLNLPPLPDESGGPEPVEGTGPGGAYEPAEGKHKSKGFAAALVIVVAAAVILLARSCN